MAGGLDPSAAAFLLTWLSEQLEKRTQSAMDRLVQMHRGGQWDAEEARSVVAEISALRFLVDAVRRNRGEL